MKMLTGLLPATEGEAQLFGEIGRCREPRDPQSGRLHVTGVLALWRTDRGPEPRLHARLRHLPHETRAARIDELVQRFGLEPYIDQVSEALPLGVASATLARGGGLSTSPRC